MRLGLVTYTCGNCGYRFQAPALSPYGYGEFLLRSPSNALAYLNALEDRTYDEVDALLVQLSEAGPWTSAQRADVLRGIYGPVACDPDEHGGAFVINAWPQCPNCGQRRGTWFEHPEPAPPADFAVAPVTHQRWGLISREEKIAAVRDEMRKLARPV